LAFVQITRTTPRLRTTLHLSQIRLTDALTFIAAPAYQAPVPGLGLSVLESPEPYTFLIIRPRLKSRGASSTRT
jgi:hypothetical protein